MSHRTVVGGLLVLCVTACTADRTPAEIDAAAREGFEQRCAASRPALSGWTQDDFDRFCSCSVERSLEALDADGRRRFVDGEPWTDGQQAAVRAAGQGCRRALGR
jgi:hypothetical protein